MAASGSDARAARRAAQRRTAKNVKAGTSGIGDIAAKARKTVVTRNGPKASEKDHLKPDQFDMIGRHAAKPSYSSVKKDVSARSDTMSVGRHAGGSEYVGKHRAPGGYDRVKDVARAYKDRAGTLIRGKHSKPGA